MYCRIKPLEKRKVIPPYLISLYEKICCDILGPAFDYMWG